MNVIPTELPEVLILEPKVFGDERGFFMESFSQRRFDEAVGRHVEFVQDNHSRSARGVLRGLHYQLAPHAQGKLVRVTSGAVFDVAVDMRRSSPRFGRWAGTELSVANHRQLSDSADFLYKTTDYYAPECERGVLWNDPAVGIRWPETRAAPLLSAKDAAAPRLQDAAAFD
jgi:dTDP-4-dehydrorhamnose 3,5-epimerase